MPKNRLLNEEQLEAARHGEGPLLIIAGAGTGKTTVITERIKYLILEKKLSASQILALTFTEKAAREMEERIDIAMPYGYTQMWISTFHAFCDRILRSDGIHIGLNPAYKLTTDSESILFLRKNIFTLSLDYFRPIGNPNKFLEGLLTHFSRLKDEDVSPNEYLRWADNQKLNPQSLNEDEIKKNLELANAYQTYEELKLKEGVMDFSDLIANTLRLFRTRKNILQNYQNQFQYILIDEFQDTNFAQNQLAILLAGDKRNINAVGDDDQAIYRWRGAAVSNIIQFREHFPDTKIVTLTKNYRSTKEILDNSYILIQNNNPDRLEVKEKVNKKLTSVRGIKGKPIELLFAKRVEDEAEQVVKKIKELTSDKYKYQDIAILVRANDHSQPFVRAFERNRIPYQFLGPGHLFHKEEIKDLIAYLKVLYNFEDSTSLYRILNIQIFGLEPREIAAILNYGRRKNLCLFEVIEQITDNNEQNIFLKKETKEKIKEITVMLKKHLSLISKDTAGQILYYFLQDSGLLLKNMEAKSAGEEKQAQNIAKFFEKLKCFEAENEDASVFAVVDWIDLSMQMGESPTVSDSDWSENNAVNILTVHSSKGLEFPIVFLVNLVTQRFPTRDRKEQIPISSDLIKEILPEGDFHLEEERRLFYVAITRAKDELFLTAANYYGEGKRERKISNFVYEIMGKKQVEEQIKNPEIPTLGQLSLLEWAPVPTVIPKVLATNPIPIDYLSYSQIATFNFCPLHYKLKYITKIPVPNTASQSFGTSLHSSLRDIYLTALSKVNINKDTILNILKKNWINEGYESKEHERQALENARIILFKYLDKNFNSKNLPKALELPFKFAIRSNDMKRNLMIGGRIDRIDNIDDEKIEIIDYKTGNNIPTEKDMANDLQLTFYALAATEVKDKLLNKSPEQIMLSLYYLDENIKLSTVRTKEQLEEAKLEILQKADEISLSNFKCSGNAYCKNCEYKMICNIS